MFTEISETPALVPITALEFVADRLISGKFPLKYISVTRILYNLMNFKY